MKIIKDWTKKKFTYFNCGETRSVKYEGDNGLCYCNKCILTVEKGE